MRLNVNEIRERERMLQALMEGPRERSGPELCRVGLSKTKVSCEHERGHKGEHSWASHPVHVTAMRKHAEISASLAAGRQPLATAPLQRVRPAVGLPNGEQISGAFYATDSKPLVACTRNFAGLRDAGIPGINGTTQVSTALNGTDAASLIAAARAEGRFWTANGEARAIEVHAAHGLVALRSFLAALPVVGPTTTTNTTATTTAAFAASGEVTLTAEDEHVIETHGFDRGAFLETKRRLFQAEADDAA